jgi:hypothetical protein
MAGMNVGDVLRIARGILSTPKRWTKGTNARNAGGKGCDATAQTASCWCMHGAIIKAASGDPNGASLSILAAREVGRLAGVHDTELYRFNDAPATTHADVVGVFTRALAVYETRT